MAAVQLVGHGGLDKLRYRCEVPVPVARAGEVLIRVAAAGVNNTDVNTRIGWYSKAIGESTGTGAAGGAHVFAVANAAKADTVRAIGADEVVDRAADLVAALGPDSVDVAIDVVAGPSWPRLLDVLRRGGRYATAGAIAGPLVELDVRTLYLKDLTLFGCTFQEDEVFENLISYIERGEIRPLVAKTFPLSEIRRAQEEFLAKAFIGKLVLVPPE